MAMAHDHEQLLHQTRTGDADALEQMLIHYLPRLRAFVRARAGAKLRQLESCSDLVQSACRDVLAALPEFEWRGEAEFRNFLFRAAWRKVVDHARRHAAKVRDADRQQPLTEADGAFLASTLTPSRDLQSREELDNIEAALAQLPDDYREAVVLRRVLGLSYAEIAEELERSEGAVRNLVSRGLARLSAHLEP